MRHTDATIEYFENEPSSICISYGVQSSVTPFAVVCSLWSLVGLSGGFTEIEPRDRRVLPSRSLIEPFFSALQYRLFCDGAGTLVSADPFRIVHEKRAFRIQQDLMVVQSRLAGLRLRLT